MCLSTFTDVPVWQLDKYVENEEEIQQYNYVVPQVSAVIRQSPG